MSGCCSANVAALSFWPPAGVLRIAESVLSFKAGIDLRRMEPSDELVRSNVFAAAALEAADCSLPDCSPADDFAPPVVPPPAGVGAEEIVAACGEALLVVEAPLPPPPVVAVLDAGGG